MPAVHFLIPSSAGEPQRVTVQAKAGKSVMLAATGAGIDGIAADCGGLLTCATCHVYVQEPWAQLLAPPSGDELGMLEFAAAQRRPTSRLSCQIEMSDALDGLTVELPDTQY